MASSTAACCLVLGLAVALSSCSGADAPEQEDARDGAFEPIEGMDGRTDLAPLTVEDLTVIRAAESRLISSCMEGEGFEYEGRTPDQYTPAMQPYLSPAELRRGGYGFDWRAAAESFLELNSPDGAADGLREAAPGNVGVAETSARSVALNGDPSASRVQLTRPGGDVVSASTEGCAAQARTTLYGSVANALRYDRAVQVLSLSGVAAELRNEEAYQVPMAAWQDCMRSVGHDVGDNSDYGGYWLQQQGALALSEQGSSQTVVTADVIQAVTYDDADCQESSGLHEVRTRLLPEVKERVAAQLGLEMTQYVEFQHAVLERALEVP